MSALDIAVARLQTEEGFRAVAYTDTTGHLTIGYGFNVNSGISKNAATALLNAQVAETQAALALNWWWSKLDDVRASVIIDIAFNDGIHGLLQYVNMLAAIGRQDWQSAHDELLNSQAAAQNPNRYKALALLLLNGA